MKFTAMRLFIMTIFVLSCGGCGGGGSTTTTAIYAGKTAVTIKISTRGTVAEKSIGGVSATLTLPDGVTLSADPTGLPDNSIVIASGAATGSTLMAKYTPATSLTAGYLTFGLINPSGFSAGECVTVTCEVTAGKNVTADQFILSDVSAVDLSGAAIVGLSASFTADIK